MSSVPRRVSLALHVSQFAYAFSYEMLQVSMPSVVDVLVGADGADATYSRLKAFFALLQLFGGLALGRLADVLGAKTVLIIAHVSSALHYYLLSATAQHWQAYFAFLPTVFQAGNQAAQTVSSEWSKDSDRVAALGRLWISYAAGGILGSIVSGAVIERGSASDALRLAGILSTLVAFLMATVLPSSPERRRADEDSSLAGLVSAWSKLLQMPGVAMFLILVVCEGLVSGMIVYTLPELARLQYSMGPALLGPLIAFELIILALSQGFLAPGVAKRLSTERVVSYGLAVAAAGCFLLTELPQVPAVLYVGILPLFMGIGVQNVLLTGVSTWIVPASQLGAMLSLNEAFGAALPGMVSPLAASMINAMAPWPAMAAVQGVLLLLISGLVYSGRFEPVFSQSQDTEDLEGVQSHLTKSEDEPQE